MSPHYGAWDYENTPERVTIRSPHTWFNCIGPEDTRTFFLDHQTHERWDILIVLHRKPKLAVDKAGNYQLTEKGSRFYTIVQNPPPDKMNPQWALQLNQHPHTDLDAAFQIKVGKGLRNLIYKYNEVDKEQIESDAALARSMAEDIIEVIDDNPRHGIFQGDGIRTRENNNNDGLGLVTIDLTLSPEPEEVPAPKASSSSRKGKAASSGSASSASAPSGSEENPILLNVPPRRKLHVPPYIGLFSKHKTKDLLSSRRRLFSSARAQDPAAPPPPAGSAGPAPIPLVVIDPAPSATATPARVTGRRSTTVATPLPAPGVRNQPARKTKK